MADSTERAADGSAYRLDEQIGFVLRRAHQRHTAIFSERMIGGLTPMQFAALARLRETGPCSQNRLGRLTAMDVATVKGVVDRLRDRGLVETAPDPDDRRRSLVTLTKLGAARVEEACAVGHEITGATLEPLSARERTDLLRLLSRIAD
jgi:DNA-binding MarR family transcriptional regulator